MNSRVEQLRQTVKEVTGVDYSGKEPKKVVPYAIQTVAVDGKVGILVNIWHPGKPRVGKQQDVMIGQGELWHLLIDGMEKGILDRKMVGKWLKQAKREHSSYINLIRQKRTRERKVSKSPTTR